MADNFDKFLPDWQIGTLTLSANSTAFTATDALLTFGSIQQGDFIISPDGRMLVIESITDDDNGVLSTPCPPEAAGTFQTRIRYQSDNSRYTGQTAALRRLLSGGNLFALSKLAGDPETVVRFLANGSFDLVDPATFGVQDPNGSLGKLAALTPETNKVFATNGSSDPILTTIAGILGYTPANRAGDTFTGAVTAPTLQARNPSGAVVGVINTGTSGSNGINYFAGADGHQWGGAGLGNMTWASNALTVPGIGSFNSTGNNVKLSVTGYGSGRGIGAQFRAGVAGSAAAVQFLNSSGTVVGSIGTTDSATAFNTSSDWRLKPSVEPLVIFELSADDFDELDNVLLRVMSMRPVRHNWHNDPLTFVHGFIAHELQAPAPHAVTGKKDAVEDIGTSVISGEIVPAHTRSETRVIDGEAVDVLIEVQEFQLPDQVYENVRPGEYENEKSWTKTGERPVYQGVDHSKLIPDLTAAIQSLTLMVLEQRDRIVSLEERLNG